MHNKYRNCFHALLIAALTLLPLAAGAEPKPSGEKVILHTNKGAITIALYPEQAPKTVANFLEYARGGFYDGVIFHRVKPRFVIQAGGYDAELREKKVRDPIENESKNRLHNDRWTVAMARHSDPDSATSQFFINLSMNFDLDPQGGKPGYTVFGIVTDGQPVVRDISLVRTHSVAGLDNVPIEPVVIERVEILP